MAIPLELQLVVTTLGTALFNQFQNSVAQVGVTAREAAATGLGQLDTTAAALLTRLGPDLQLAFGRTVSAMRTMAGEAGTITPAALDTLAGSIDRVRVAYLESIPAYEGLIRQGLAHRTLIAELTPVQQASIATLEAQRDSVLAHAAAMREEMSVTAELVVQQQAVAMQYRTMMTATGEAISVMRTMEEEGTLTSQVLERLANSLARTKMEMLKSTEAYAQFIPLGLTTRGIINELSGEELRNISILDTWERSIRAKAAALRESEAALRTQQQAMARNTDSTMLVSSVTQGLMMAMGALQGNLMSVGFGLIFLRFAIAPIVLAVAGLVTVLGGLVKIARGVMRSITSLGTSLDEFTFRLRQATGAAVSAGAVWLTTIDWAEKAARPIDEVSEALGALATEKLLREDIIAAVFEYATAKGKPLAEAVREIAEAIGTVSADPEALKKLGVAWEDIADATDRSAVILATVDALMDQFGGTIEERAETITGGMDRIRAAWAGVQAVFAEPIWNEILTPFVELLARATTNIRDMAQEIWRSGAVQTEWNRTLALGRDMMAWLTRAYKENEELIRFFLQKALIGVLAVFRGLLWVGKNLAESMLMLAQAFQFFLRVLKPVRDFLGRIAAGLKEIGFGPVLAVVKEFAVDFPGGILGALLTAAAILKGPRALAIPLLLGRLAAQILLEYLNLDELTKERWENVFDWMFVLGLIGAFFGPVGMAIGLALGGLIGLHQNFEDEWWAGWASVFGFTTLGALIGSYFGPAGALIGGFLGAVIGLFINFESEIYAIFWDVGVAFDRLAIKIGEATLKVLEWLSYLPGAARLTDVFAENIREGVAKAQENIEKHYEWIRAGQPPLPTWGPMIPDFDAWLAEQEARGDLLLPPSPVTLTAVPTGAAAGAGLRTTGAGAAPTIVNYINVTGNTILNEDDARRLADKINRATMGNLTNRFGMQLGRVG